MSNGLTNLDVLKRLLEHPELQDRFQKELLGSEWWTKLSTEQIILACLSEIGELIDSSGFKWWTKSPQDIFNMAVELVDLHHFLLTYILFIGHWSKPDLTYLEPTITKYIVSLTQPKESESPLIELTVIVGSIRQASQYCSSYIEDIGSLISHIWTANLSLPLSKFDLLYRAKLKLNYERQTTGYWNDPSVKFIDGKEDNEALRALLLEET